jgi:hypothetical protein
VNGLSVSAARALEESVRPRRLLGPSRAFPQLYP